MALSSAEKKEILAEYGLHETDTGSPEAQVVGQLELAVFFNEAGLEAIGDNLLLETAASGPATVGTPGDVGYGSLLHGYTEASNVDAVSEISALIVAQRAYEMNSKVIQAALRLLRGALHDAHDERGGPR